MLLQALLACVLALFAIAAATAVTAQRPIATRLTYTASAFVSALALLAALGGLAIHDPMSTSLPFGLPWLGSHFRLDSLAAFFLIVVNFGGCAASVFGIGYGQHERTPGRVLPFFPAFLAAMNLVVLADDAFSFLLSWELMSLMSWALVISQDKSPDNLRAGYIYILMASFGTLALLLAFGILAGPGGGYLFGDMRAHALTQPQTIVVLLLLLIGAGSKAGVVPLHAWLPLAHPAAPSHVSALMSGVMTKVAVYAFIRVAFDILGPLDWRLSMIVITAGGATALLGVLYALMQHDLKRLLAYHTVENIGIIFAGLGLALAYRANGLAEGAALALSAALFHVFNHSIFKSLLFFGSGAVLTATGERDMEQLGGLIRRMPWTGTVFLIGSAAISALPPLNGFASEWLVFQAIFRSPTLPEWGLRLLAPATGAMLALAAALAAACFVKAFGVSFLGRARSAAADAARETDRFSLAVMLGLAAVCVIAGAFPGYFLHALSPVTSALCGAVMPDQNLAAPWTPIVPFAGSTNAYSGFTVLACLCLATALTVLGVRLFANPSVRRGPAWDCGFPDPSPATQYTATSFAEPIRRVFGSIIFSAREEVVMPAPGEVSAAQLHVTMRDPAWDAFYAPIAAGVSYVADRANGLQFLTIRRYLTVVFATLVFLLLVLALWV